MSEFNLWKSKYRSYLLDSPWDNIKYIPLCYLDKDIIINALNVLISKQRRYNYYPLHTAIRIFIEHNNLEKYIDNSFLDKNGITLTPKSSKNTKIELYKEEILTHCKEQIQRKKPISNNYIRDFLKINIKGNIRKNYTLYYINHCDNGLVYTATFILCSFPKNNTIIKALIYRLIEIDLINSINWEKYNIYVPDKLKKELVLLKLFT